MLLPLGHPTLLLLAGILCGVAAQEPRYQVNQLESISAPAGSSVTLPCNFSYPNNIKPVRDLRVYWRQGGFHGKFIYNHTERFTHQDYRNRITLVGDPHGEHTASICIDRLQESDASVYVCHLRVWKNNGQWEQWRNITGTNLTVLENPLVQAASEPASEGDSPPPPCAQARASVTSAPCTKPTPATKQMPGQRAAPLIGGALAGAVLLAVLIGLAVYSVRKRKGHPQKEPPARREEPQEQAERRHEYMEVGAGHSNPPPQRPPDPQEPGLLYAALNFAEPGAAQRPLETRQAPGAETLYSAVRIQ